MARERLAKAGELSEAEREKIKLEGEITGIMADFFTKKIDIDALWQRLKEKGSESIVKETQLRLAHTLSVGGSDLDFDRYAGAILRLETLKADNAYAAVEANVDLMKKLRKKYITEKDSAFVTLKERMGDQVRKAAHQMVGQRNRAIDVEGSVDAGIKASPQWRDFVMKFENNYSSQFEALQAKLVQEIQ
jgi:uncharacterized protein YjhX (UPF0386 family)